VLYPANVEPMQWQPQKLHLVVESTSEKAVEDAIEFLDRAISRRQKARAERIETQTSRLRSARLRARFLTWGRSVIDLFCSKAEEGKEAETIAPNPIPSVQYVEDDHLEIGTAAATPESEEMRRHV